MKRPQKIPAVLQSVSKALRSHETIVYSHGPDKDSPKFHLLTLSGPSKIIKKLIDDIEVYDNISSGYCPDCGHKDFARIADGGGSELIACKHCKSRFVHGLPLFAERARGFTVVELMIVMAIVVMLGLMLYPHVRPLIVPFFRHILGA
jgi:prepilin-type N-terminal cleavage/methylation domain-containing protein